MSALGLPVIVLSEQAEPADRLIAAQLGATALLEKSATLAELVLAINKASQARVERRQYTSRPASGRCLR